MKLLDRLGDWFDRFMEARRIVELQYREDQILHLLDGLTLNEKKQILSNVEVLAHVKT